MWSSAPPRLEDADRDSDGDEADEDIEGSDHDEGEGDDSEVRKDREDIEDDEASEDQEAVEEGEGREDDDNTSSNEDSASDSDSDLEYAGKHGISGLLKVCYQRRIVFNTLTVLYRGRNGSGKWPRSSSAMIEMLSTPVRRRQRPLVPHTRRYVASRGVPLYLFSTNAQPSRQATRLHAEASIR